MKGMLVTFGSQNLTFSRFLDVCWRKEFHLLGRIWWQVPKYPFTLILTMKQIQWLTRQTWFSDSTMLGQTPTFFLPLHPTFWGVRSPLQIQTGCKQLQRLQKSLQKYPHKNKEPSFLSLVLHSHFSGLVMCLARNQWLLEPGEKRDSPTDRKEYSISFQVKGEMKIVRPSQGLPKE